jgi:hypothetical protein
MRPDYLGFLFLASSVVSFNGALWQVSRRKQKVDLLESHKNLTKPALKEMPERPLEEYKPTDIEFRQVELEGSFDNEGSVLVGPRSLPSYKGASTNEERNSGFIVMTPFEVKGTNQFIMVNRGWVPIDAGKHRRLLAKYIGEGFTPTTVRGIFKKEEFIWNYYGLREAPENFAPMAAELAWMCIRPYNMLLEYYERRWGADSVNERVMKHGARHYAVEMIEDFSGDDQVVINNQAWPRRKDMDELTYVHLTPIVHVMYAVFWTFVSVGSVYGMAMCFKRQKMMFADRRKLNREVEEIAKRRQNEAAAYQTAMNETRAREVAEEASRMARK